MTKDTYAEKAVSQIPRLLTCLDRNPFSPTYGCFNREFWLTRTRDFPDAIAQFGMLSLALVWAHQFPGGEQYYQNEEIKKWILAGIKYWMKIQHQDGSFDEFYPNERGWAGPTGFLLYAVIRSYELLGDDFPEELKSDFFAAVKKSAWFLATREEPGVLANHHAMALLPIYQSYFHLKKTDSDFSQELLKHFNLRLDSFFSYCDEEGWCLEYDGADPGYLSATVSFLSKMQKYMEGSEAWKQKIQTVIDSAIDFSSYFFYPNGSYGGTLGSRQTLHFYPHGFELQGPKNPTALSCADFGLKSLQEGKLVPPEIQDERYHVYRVPEFLESYVDFAPRTEQKPPLLPHQSTPFEKYFENAKIYIKNTPSHYLLINLAKGGIAKIHDKQSKMLVSSDDGLVALLKNGKVFTTQWIGEEYKIEKNDHAFTVQGQMHQIPFKFFTPLTMISFRLFTLAFGWNAKLAEFIKGSIRKLLMTKSAKSQISFLREFEITERNLTITNRIDSQAKISSLRIGGQFASRYVPQSRYFQHEELTNDYWEIKNPDASTILTQKIVFDFSRNKAELLS